MTSTPEPRGGNGRDARDLAAEIVRAYDRDPAWLDAFADELDRRRGGAALERLVRVWGLSYTEAGQLFGVTRQALQKWIRQGVPSERAGAVADAARITDLLIHHLERDRIPAVVRQPAVGMDGLTLIEQFRTQGSTAALETTRAMFAFGEAHS